MTYHDAVALAKKLKNLSHAITRAPVHASISCFISFVISTHFAATMKMK